MVTGYIYIYRFNPVESNHRDGPTGHKNDIIVYYHVVAMYYTCYILEVIYWFITSQFHGIVVDSVTMAIEILCIHNKWRPSNI